MRGQDLIVISKLKKIAIISLIFMAVELLGGYYAHSVAILADAFHLLSDVLAYMISLFAVLMSYKISPFNLTFGYEKLQPLGALLNVVIIWIVTLQLFFEATKRIIDQEIVNEPTYMLITSFFGLACNLYIMKVLHSDEHAGGHHNCSHDHGKKKLHDHSSHQHHNHNHTHDHKGHNCSSHKKEFENLGVAQQLSLQSPSISSAARYRNCQIRQQENHHQKQHNHQQCSNHVHDELAKGKEHHHQHHQHQKKDKSTNHKKSRSHQHQKCEGHNHHHQKKLSDEFNLYSIGSDEQIELKNDGAHKFENINIEAAYIHIITDIILSIGVIVSASIIYVFAPLGQKWTYWQLADPFCTYLFSIMAIYSTIPITKQSIVLLLDGCEKPQIVLQIKNELSNHKLVKQFKDLRIWSMNRNKYYAVVKVSAKTSNWSQLQSIKKIFTNRNVKSYVQFTFDSEEIINHSS